MKRILMFLVVIACCILPSCAMSGGLAWCGAQDIFMWNASSDIAGYRVIDHIPELSDQRLITSGPITDASGKVLLGSWVTPNGSPGVPTLAPGLWRFRTYAYSSTTSGVTTLEFVLLNRSSSGIETNLFYNKVISEDIDATGTPKEYLLSYARRNATTFFPGDRLVVKAYASTTSASARTLTLIVAGNTNASMVASSYYVCPALSDCGVAGVQRGAASTPVSPLIPVVAVGLLLVSAAYVKRK